MIHAMPVASSPVLAVAYSTPAVAIPWHRAVYVAVAALCTGCVDSYPTEDVFTVSPYEMTQAQRIESLNALGAQGRNRERWRYAIDAGCVLSVSHRPVGTGWATTSYRLDEASIETGYDKVEVRTTWSWTARALPHPYGCWPAVIVWRLSKAACC